MSSCNTSASINSLILLYSLIKWR